MQIQALQIAKSTPAIRILHSPYIESLNSNAKENSKQRPSSDTKNLHVEGQAGEYVRTTTDQIPARRCLAGGLEGPGFLL